MTNIKRTHVYTHMYDTTNSLSLGIVLREYKVNDCSIGYRQYRP